MPDVWCPLPRPTRFLCVAGALVRVNRPLLSLVVLAYCFRAIAINNVVSNNNILMLRSISRWKHSVDDDSQKLQCGWNHFKVYMLRLSWNLTSHMAWFPKPLLSRFSILVDRRMYVYRWRSVGDYILSCTVNSNGAHHNNLFSLNAWFSVLPNQLASYSAKLYCCRGSSRFPS